MLLFQTSNPMRNTDSRWHLKSLLSQFAWHRGTQVPCDSAWFPTRQSYECTRLSTAAAAGGHWMWAPWSNVSFAGPPVCSWPSRSAILFVKLSKLGLCQLDLRKLGHCSVKLWWYVQVTLASSSSKQYSHIVTKISIECIYLVHNNKLIFYYN